MGDRHETVGRGCPESLWVLLSLLWESLLRETGGSLRVEFAALATPGGAVVTPGSPQNCTESHQEIWLLKQEPET